MMTYELKLPAVKLFASTTRPMPDLKDYMTTEEAAKKMGFHVEHIRRMRRQGKLKGKKVGAMWFILRESVEKHLQEMAGKNKFGPRPKKQ
jgi:excisionase family DNA binding protein